MVSSAVLLFLPIRAFKYVDQKHGGVPTEWQTIKITTAYNAYVDADACCVQAMANAAFFQHFPLQSRSVEWIIT